MGEEAESSASLWALMAKEFKEFSIYLFIYFIYFFMVLRWKNPLFSSLYFCGYSVMPFLLSFLLLGTPYLLSSCTRLFS